MPKASTRFRNRKINFKTRIGVVIGSLDITSDHDGDDVAFEDGARSNRQGHSLETGVDKDEESEHHLQQVINASLAALDASIPSVGTSAGSAREAHIPIPDATGLVDPAAYEALYTRPSGLPFALPSTYIRFSDTVEDSLGGVSYTMDEQDENWLETFNSAASMNPLNGVDGPSKLPNGCAEDNYKARRGSPRKGKEKERAEETGVGHLSEADFELLMDFFEKLTEETVPGLRMDVTLIPSLAQLEHHFSDSSAHPRLSSIKIFAKFVYAHWKERRLKRGGRSIIPELDFDESNDNNPYVCFRRREIKAVRKTRRTDAQNLERLLRLRGDLHSVAELLAMVAERERMKRELLAAEKAIFDGRCELREIKRKLGEPTGDEDLLVGKREKKPRPRPIELPGIGTVKVSLQRSTRGNTSALGPLSPTAIANELNTHRDRGQSIQRVIEKELLRRRDGDNGWEDWTDSAYQPLPTSVPAKMWRVPAAAVPGESHDASPGFEQGPVVALPGVIRPHYRRRVGRGGRVMVDRIVPHHKTSAGFHQLIGVASASTSKAGGMAKMDEDLDRRRRLEDRWRFDDDVRLDFPSTFDGAIVDDFLLAFGERRRQLLQSHDLRYLDTDSETYLNSVREWLDRAPDPEPPVVKVGRLPGKPAVAPVAPLSGLGMPGGLGPRSGQIPAGSPTSVHDQMLAAVAHAHGLGLGNPPSFRRPGGKAAMLPPQLRTTNGNMLANAQQPQQITSQQLALMQQQQQHLLAQLTWQQQQQQQQQSPSSANAANAANGAAHQYSTVANQMLAQYNLQGMPAQDSVNRTAAQVPLGSQLVNLPINGMARSPMMNGIPMPNGIARPSSSGSEQHRSPALGPQSCSMNMSGASPRPGSAASSHHTSPVTTDALPVPMQQLLGSPAISNANLVKRSPALGPLQTSALGAGMQSVAGAAQLQALHAAVQQQARAAGVLTTPNGSLNGAGLGNGLFAFGNGAANGTA